MKENDFTPESEVGLRLLTRQMYGEDTIGQLYFPEVLEGRQRPEDFAEVPIHFGKKTDREIERLGAEHSISSLFNLRQEELESLPKSYQTNIHNKLQYYVKDIARKYATTPQARLIGVILREPQGPVDPKDEASLAFAVNDVLATLSDNEQEIIRLRFGIDNFQINTLEDVGKRFGVTRERIRQVESRTISRLSRPENARIFENMSRHYNHNKKIRTLGILK